jgi:NAD(P)-dependent dehydrogenase (short-subunit alcohol dehydrogenase family)
MARRTLVVTGGLGVLGACVARRAAAEDWRVFSLDQQDVDLTDAEATHRVMGELAAQAGGVDALVNAAGGFVWSPVADADASVWARMTAVNLTTAVNACRAALPYLANSSAGRIVNVGAAGALDAQTGMAPYAASKAGVHRLTESLAREWKGQVTVNAVLPSIIDTPQNRAEMPDADFSAWVSPDELATVILFLASESAGGVTGALLPVMGRV